MKLRAGAATTGTEAAAGTDNSQTDPRIITFDPPVRPCIITNHCTNAAVLVKVNAELNGTVSNDFDNDSDDDGLGHFALPPNDGAVSLSPSWVDLSLGGAVNVHSVSFITTNAGDDLDDVSVVGWAP